jgi:hypothetical protein
LLSAHFVQSPHSPNTKARPEAIPKAVAPAVAVDRR